MIMINTNMYMYVCIYICLEVSGCTLYCHQTWLATGKIVKKIGSVVNFC